jgi:hypothetical protein
MAGVTVTLGTPVAG